MARRTGQTCLGKAGDGRCSFVREFQDAVCFRAGDAQYASNPLVQPLEGARCERLGECRAANRARRRVRASKGAIALFPTETRLSYAQHCKGSSQVSPRIATSSRHEDDLRTLQLAPAPPAKLAVVADLHPETHALACCVSSLNSGSIARRVMDGRSSSQIRG
jgi:hypothetical protein